jgi:hypothetical protein
MKTVRSLLSIGLGFAIAWTILTFVPKPKVSNYGFGPGNTVLNPWPVEMDNSNLALIGVGLEARTPAPASVMDASPASSAKPVMLTGQSPKPVMMASSPMPATRSPAPSVPAMMMASPSPAPSVPVMMASPSPSPTMPSPSS